jgi:hypothetical protein
MQSTFHVELLLGAVDEQSAIPTGKKKYHLISLEWIAPSKAVAFCYRLLQSLL